MKLQFIAAIAAASFALPATADDTHAAMKGDMMGAMDGYMQPMDEMMAAMADVAPAGDADADFLLMMIPHHQSAVDMARVVLEEGDDPEIRDMAQEPTRWRQL